MQDELVSSYDFSKGLNKYILVNTERAQHFTHEEEDQMMESGLRKLVNVDGEYGKRVIPFPHTAAFTAEALRYDKMSVADRLSEIKDSLTPNELSGVEAFVLLCSGGTLETTSFFEFLHWWALSDYSYQGCIDYLVKYKFRGGQSSFAIRFFREALASGNLSYAFNSPVAEIDDTKDFVTISTRDGKQYRAKRVISAIPLQVMNNVVFNPPLPSGKRTAASIGHVNQCVKVHAEVRNKDLRSYTGITRPENGLFYAFGDGTTPAGNTHIVAFGGQNGHFDPEDNIGTTARKLQGLVPMDIERLVSLLPTLSATSPRLIIEPKVFHNWSKDEFAKGAWFFSQPGLLSNHLGDMRARHGKVIFGSSDWALGWRSFIDGAIEEGTRAALTARTDLAPSQLKGKL